MTEKQRETSQRFGFAILTAVLTTVMHMVAVTWYVRGWQVNVDNDMSSIKSTITRIETDVGRVKEVYIPRSEYQTLVERVERVDNKQDRMFELLLEIRRDMQDSR